MLLPWLFILCFLVWIFDKDIKESIPVWDDMFVKRGLSETDLTNYVLVVQYVILTEYQSSKAL